MPLTDFSLSAGSTANPPTIATSSTTASSSSFPSLSPHQSNILNSIITSLPQNAHTFLQIVSSYQHVLSQNGLKVEDDVEFYELLLKLAMERGSDWNQKWEGVRAKGLVALEENTRGGGSGQGHGHDGGGGGRNHHHQGRNRARFSSNPPNQGGRSSAAVAEPLAPVNPRPIAGARRVLTTTDGEERGKAGGGRGGGHTDGEVGPSRAMERERRARTRADLMSGGGGGARNTNIPPTKTTTATTGSSRPRQTSKQPPPPQSTSALTSTTTNSAASSDLNALRSRLAALNAKANANPNIINDSTITTTNTPAAITTQATAGMNFTRTSGGGMAYNTTTVGTTSASRYPASSVPPNTTTNTTGTTTTITATPATPRPPLPRRQFLIPPPTGIPPDTEDSDKEITHPTTKTTFGSGAGTGGLTTLQSRFDKFNWNPISPPPPIHPPPTTTATTTVGTRKSKSPFATTTTINNPGQESTDDDEDATESPPASRRNPTNTIAPMPSFSAYTSSKSSKGKEKERSRSRDRRDKDKEKSPYPYPQTPKPTATNINDNVVGGFGHLPSYASSKRDVRVAIVPGDGGEDGEERMAGRRGYHPHPASSHHHHYHYGPTSVDVDQDDQEPQTDGGLNFGGGGGPTAVASRRGRGKLPPTASKITDPHYRPGINRAASLQPLTSTPAPSRPFSVRNRDRDGVGVDGGHTQFSLPAEGAPSTIRPRNHRSRSRSRPREEDGLPQEPQRDRSKSRERGPHNHQQSREREMERIQREREKERERERELDRKREETLKALAKEREMERQAERFRNLSLMGRGWDRWRERKEVIMMTENNVDLALRNITLPRYFTTWKSTLSRHRSLRSTAIAHHSSHLLLQYFNLWRLRRKQRWELRLREAWTMVRARWKRGVLERCWWKWRWKLEEIKVEREREIKMAGKCLNKWKRRFDEKGRMEKVADEVWKERKVFGVRRKVWEKWKWRFALKIGERDLISRKEVRERKEVFTVWRWKVKLGNAERMVEYNHDNRLLGQTWDVWVERSNTGRVAIDFRIASLQRVAFARWRGRFNSLGGLDQQADDFRIPHQQALMRKAFRYWLTEERGLLLRRVANTRSRGRLLGYALGAWVARTRKIKDELERRKTVFQRMSKGRQLKSAFALWRNRLTTHQNALSFATDYDSRSRTVHALYHWRKALRQKKVENQKGVIARGFFLQKRSWTLWMHALQRRRRQEWVDNNNKKRLKVAFSAWLSATRRERADQALVEGFQAVVDERVVGDALRSWLNQVIEIRNREIEVEQMRDWRLLEVGFAKWTDACYRHGGLIQEADSFYDRSQKEHLRQALHGWRSKTQQSRERRAKLKTFRQTRRQRLFFSAWQKWRDKFLESELRDLELVVKENHENSLLKQGFASLISTSKAITAIRFAHEHTLLRAFEKWRQAAPRQRDRVFAEDFERHSLQMKAWETWRSFFRGKIAVRAANRFRPFVVACKPDSPAPRRSKRQPQIPDRQLAGSPTPSSPSSATSRIQNLLAARRENRELPGLAPLVGDLRAGSLAAEMARAAAVGKGRGRGRSQSKPAVRLRDLDEDGEDTITLRARSDYQGSEA